MPTLGLSYNMSGCHARLSASVLSKGTKRPENETSKEQKVQGTKRPRNETSKEQNVQGTNRPKTVFRSWERNVLGTKSPVTAGLMILYPVIVALLQGPLPMSFPGDTSLSTELIITATQILVLKLRLQFKIIQIKTQIKNKQKSP